MAAKSSAGFNAREGSFRALRNPLQRSNDKNPGAGTFIPQLYFLLLRALRIDIVFACGQTVEVVPVAADNSPRRIYANPFTENPLVDRRSAIGHSLANGSP